MATDEKRKMNPQLKKKLSMIGRMVLSGTILVYLLSKIDLTVARESLSVIRFEYLALALVPSLVEVLLKSFKWQMLLWIKKIKVPFFEIFKIYYISSFIGTFLPSSLGIDVLRSYSMSRFIRNTHDSVSTVFVDRLLGVLALIFVVLTGVLLVRFSFVDNIYRFVITIAVVLFLLFGGIIVSRHLILLLEKFLIWLKVDAGRYIDLLHRIYDSIIEFKNNKFALFRVFLVSIVFQFSRIAITWCVGLSFGINLDVKYWIIIVPLVTLAAMLPLAVGGIGIREGAFVFFFTKLGVPFETAFLLSIIIFLFAVFNTIPGLIFYLIYGLSSVRTLNTELKQ